MKNSLLKCIAAGSILKVIYDKMHPVLSPSGWDDISNLMRSHSIMTVETFILGVLLFLTLLIQKTETLVLGSYHGQLHHCDLSAHASRNLTMAVLHNYCLRHDAAQRYF